MKLENIKLFIVTKTKKMAFFKDFVEISPVRILKELKFALIPSELFNL